MTVVPVLVMVRLATKPFPHCEEIWYFTLQLSSAAGAAVGVGVGVAVGTGAGVAVAVGVSVGVGTAVGVSFCAEAAVAVAVAVAVAEIVTGDAWPVVGVGEVPPECVWSKGGGW